MKYLNLSVEVLKSPEFGACDYHEIGVWLILASYCATVENGGVIKGSKSWGDRQWITVGCTKQEVSNCSLFSFKGNDLHVFHYPVEQEAALKAKREAGKKGGRPPKNKDLKPHGLQKDNHMVSSEHNVIVKEGNSKGKEGNIKEEKDPRMDQVASLVKRRESTKWSDKEIKQFKKIDPSQEDIDFLISKGYSNHQYRRRDLITLLNNWSGELDRMNQSSFNQQTNTNPFKSILD